MRALREDLEVLELRYDGYTNLMRVAQVITYLADWKTLCSRPTLAGIAERTGLSRDTVKRHVRWLRHRGWLGTVEEGTTVRYRKGTQAGLLDDGFGNRAAVWVLCVRRRIDVPPRQPHQSQTAHQPQKITAPPSVSLPSGEIQDPSHARARRSPSRDHSRISTGWALHETPGTKRDRLAACERLRRESAALRRMTAWYLRWALREFWAAGATPADVLHALDVRPDDSRWTYTWSSVEELRHVPGWVRHRLQAWIGPDGQVLALPSQQRAARLARQRAEYETWRVLQQQLEDTSAAGPRPAPAPRLSRNEALAPAPPVAANARCSDPGRLAAVQAYRALAARRLVDQAAPLPAPATAVPRLVEREWVPPVDDGVVDPRELALARARTRARLERLQRAAATGAG
ncbi:hypothetical protein ACIBHX_46535 [Nonomuraea sp. NPDC050536]|uniref:hypothetical protein n=1 Tax=Nonomuraea sp. NPDC050536 TaxID=3364366 RepID=UPI0037C77569